MKKILPFIIFINLISAFAGFAQETITTSEGKKLFVGLSGAYVNANGEDNWGGSLHGEYFVHAKVSIEGAYTYSTSTVKITSEYSKFPASNQNTTPGDAKAYNNNHYVNLGARYYFLGGAASDSPLGIYAGIGIGFGIFRSTEYANPNDNVYSATAYTTPLNVWRVFYLPISVGIDYALGPGKVFAQGMAAPRLFNVGSSPDKDAFEGLYHVNVGYKIGF